VNLYKTPGAARHILLYFASLLPKPLCDRIVHMLILASNSPRRRQLLGWLELPFEVSAANIDETPLPGEKPDDYTCRLARQKALAVLADCRPGDLILASDTTVAALDFGEGQAGQMSILGKPEHAAEAEAMLRSLRGRTHQVFTAVALLRKTAQPSNGTGAGEAVQVELCSTDVMMRSYSDEEMVIYIASGDPLDKAGAYAIQHGGFHPVEGIEGCFASVMGFPLCHVLRLLRAEGIIPRVNVPRHCLAELGYDCPVYHQIYQPVT
jgi:septum formation protein